MIIDGVALTTPSLPVTPIPIPREQLSIPVDEDRLGGVGLAVFGGSFDELAGLEASAGPDERDEVRGVDRAPAVLGGLDELERHRQPRRAGARPAGDLGPVSDRGKGRLRGYLEPAG